MVPTDEFNRYGEAFKTFLGEESLFSSLLMSFFEHEFGTVTVVRGKSQFFSINCRVVGCKRCFFDFGECSGL